MKKNDHQDREQRICSSFQVWEQTEPENGFEGTVCLLDSYGLQHIHSPEALRAGELVVSQSLFESRILSRGTLKSPVCLEHVRKVHLLAERDKVALYFFRNLAAALPSLRLISIEGERDCCLSVDRDQRVDAYAFMVTGKRIQKVIQFYPETEEGMVPYLFLPGIDPAHVCRPYRVQLMMPYFAHPEWYSEQERNVYEQWLHRYGKQFFMQAIEEGHGELLVQYLQMPGDKVRFFPSTIRSFLDKAGDLGYSDLTGLLEENARA